MNISPVSQNLNNKLSVKQNIKVKKQAVSFGAHPDFCKLFKKYSVEILASSYFRRGPFYGSPDSRFQDVVNIFRDIFTKNLQKPQKMLIAGVGESQEPFSYLAVIKNIIKDKKLEDVLDLNIVDLQSKPSYEQLFKNSYYESSRQPEYANDSFIKDVRSNVRYGCFGYYRVKDEIFDFLNSVYCNKKKSLWETRVQEAVKEYKPEDFDIVSINNTFGYIHDKQIRIDAAKDVYRIGKKDSYYITDPYANAVEEASLLDKYQYLAYGIYKKK